MPIQYSLLDNQLTTDPDDYRAVVQTTEVLGEDDLINDMTSRGSTATKTDVLAVLEEYKAAIERAIADGKRINTDLVNVYPSIRGVFDGNGDSYDATRHAVRVNVSSGVRLREATRGVSLEKVRAGETGPLLDHYHDTLADEIDGLVTPGGGARITGGNLKVREVDGAGVYFVDSEGNATEAPNLMRNKPGDLIFLVPQLAPGDYALEVRTASTDNGTLRTGRLEAVLTVAG